QPAQLPPPHAPRRRRTHPMTPTQCPKSRIFAHDDLHDQPTDALPRTTIFPTTGHRRSITRPVSSLMLHRAIPVGRPSAYSSASSRSSSSHVTAWRSRSSGGCNASWRLPSTCCAVISEIVSASPPHVPPNASHVPDGLTTTPSLGSVRNRSSAPDSEASARYTASSKPSDIPSNTIKPAEVLPRTHWSGAVPPRSTVSSSSAASHIRRRRSFSRNTF